MTVKTQQEDIAARRADNVADRLFDTIGHAADEYRGAACTPDIPGFQVHQVGVEDIDAVDDRQVGIGRHPRPGVLPDDAVDRQSPGALKSLYGSLGVVAEDAIDHQPLTGAVEQLLQHADGGDAVAPLEIDIIYTVLLKLK